jgi:hypothetical protein
MVNEEEAVEDNMQHDVGRRWETQNDTNRFFRFFKARHRKA